MNRTIQERGYIVPVKRRLSEGVYKKAHARSLEPNKRGNIEVAFDSGKTSEWSSDVTIHEPAGFIVRTKFKNQIIRNHKKTKVACRMCKHFYENTGEHPVAKTKSGIQIGVIGMYCQKLNHYFVSDDDMAAECEAFTLEGVEIKAHNDEVADLLHKTEMHSKRLTKIEEQSDRLIKAQAKAPAPVYNISGDANISNN